MLVRRFVWSWVRRGGYGMALFKRGGSAEVPKVKVRQNKINEEPLYEGSSSGGETMIPPAQFDRFYKHSYSKSDQYIKQILQQMKSSSVDRKRVHTMIAYYLDSNKNIRTASGLLTLTTLIGKFSREEETSFGHSICQFIIRSESMADYICNYRSLEGVVELLVKKQREASQKIKKALIKYKLLQILKVNIERVNYANLCRIINAVLGIRNQDIASQKLRFISLAMLLEQRINVFLESGFFDKCKDKSKSVGIYLSTIFRYYAVFVPKNERSVALLFNTVDKYVFSQSVSYNKYFVYSCYANFPWVGANSKGVFYKDKVLARLKQEGIVQKLMDVKGQDWLESNLCYTMLQFTFYRHMKQLRFKHGEFNYLKAEDLSTPVLDDLFWQIYRKNAHSINKYNRILGNILKTHYPDKYIETEVQPFKDVKIFNLSQNEVKQRIIMALRLLQIPFEAEMLVSGRSVDFMLEDKVILQCDGDYHYNMHKMEYNVETEFRNMHLALSGYQLITVNIFQYNRYRYSQQLAELIGKKLKFMRENKAVVVI